MSDIPKQNHTVPAKAEKVVSGRTFTQYFTELAAKYLHSTGNSTYKVIYAFLQEKQPSIVDADSVVSDNACGPCVATAAVVQHLGREPARVEATDNVQAMVDAAEHRVNAMGWKHVKISVMDSHELKFPDETFTVAISNISVTTYTDPYKCLHEMLRTLKPRGVAIVTAWKRFGASELIHAAQKKVRATAEPMKVPKAEYMREGYLQDVISKTGFKAVHTDSVSILCQGEEIEGIRDFILGDFTRSVRQDWTEEEKSRWPRVVQEVVQDEVASYGGIRFDAWVVTGTK
ncbi:MAG: hypothetical protein Q9162_005126 [Coniocarpon cinnabarinum]